MILGKIRIQKFKSIKDSGWIYLSNTDLITILAGQNESGKTSFLRALKFFEEGKYDSFEDEDRRMEEPPRVDCTFYLTDSEYEDLKKETNKKIADYFKKNGINFLRGDIKEDNFELRYTYPEDLKKLITEFDNSKKENQEKDDDQVETTEKEFDIFQYFKKIKPEMVFYSSFSENILPGKITYPELAKNEAVLDFESVYNVDFQELLKPSTKDQKRTREEERIRKEAEDSLNTYWNQVISGEVVKYSFAISLRPNTDLNSSYVNFYINQGDESQLSVSQKSQGFQWFMGFNLRLRSHEQAMSKHGLILLIDEPGQGLHEVAQEDVKAVIEELAKESNIQIIYSTHQPILLGKENIDFSRIRFADRTKKDGSKFKTISQLVSSNGSKDSLSPVKSALGLVSINNLSGKKLSVISEGITEYFYLKTIFGDKYIIFPSAGVDQVSNVFGILLGWGVNTKVVVDDDMQGKKAFNKIKKEFFGNQDSEDFKKTIKKISGSGIEDLLSEAVIKEIMKDYGKAYSTEKSKVENVSEVGKFIFAKSFFDKYQNNLKNLDEETKNNFQEIEAFLK